MEPLVLNHRVPKQQLDHRAVPTVHTRVRKRIRRIGARARVCVVVIASWIAMQLQGYYPMSEASTVCACDTSILYTQTHWHTRTCTYIPYRYTHMHTYTYTHACMHVKELEKSVHLIGV